MKNFVSIFSISLFLLLLWRCNPLFEQKEEKGEKRAEVVRKNVEKKFEAEKRSTAENLREWSDKLDRRIKQIDRQIANANDKTKNSLNELRTRLVKEKRTVDRSLKDIEQSTGETWDKVRKRSNEILREAKIEAQKIEERAENLID